MRRSIVWCVAVSMALGVASRASAHFPWLVVNENGKAAYFFGETPADRAYKMPAPIAKAEIHKQDAEANSPVATVKVENDKFIGLESTEPVGAEAKLSSRVTYGIYQGARLDYYTLHQGGALPKEFKAPVKPDTAPELEAFVVDTEAGVDIHVRWKGQPLSGAETTLFCDEGHDEGSAKTDDAGKASFTDAQVEDGLNGILVGYTAKDDSGELNGKPYKSSAHYLTITFAKP